MITKVLDKKDGSGLQADAGGESLEDLPSIGNSIGGIIAEYNIRQTDSEEKVFNLEESKLGTTMRAVLDWPINLSVPLTNEKITELFAEKGVPFNSHKGIFLLGTDWHEIIKNDLERTLKTPLLQEILQQLPADKQIAVSFFEAGGGAAAFTASSSEAGKDKRTLMFPGIPKTGEIAAFDAQYGCSLATIWNEFVDVVDKKGVSSRQFQIFSAAISSFLGNAESRVTGMYSPNDLSSESYLSLINEEIQTILKARKPSVVVANLNSFVEKIKTEGFYNNMQIGDMKTVEEAINTEFKRLCKYLPQLDSIKIDFDEQGFPRFSKNRAQCSGSGNTPLQLLIHLKLHIVGK